ncbi:hypothetical protein F0562_028334 [Nyssa sinensis]|uniref:PGG domain-containing protein n=1 Tax=Nyssa sinensis TaxID=561372 RepID=A0A5J5BC19_9ASTE|nr:hypothetical protein F0562_028334 [Nyssa sinensis]
MERTRHLLSLFDEEKEEEMVMRDKTRAEKLHQAALKGTLNSLLELVQEDPSHPQHNHTTIFYPRYALARRGISGSPRIRQRTTESKAGTRRSIEFTRFVGTSRGVSKRMIKYLLTTTGIEVNSGNANGLTALDVLSQSPRDLRDMEIKECLHGGGGGGGGRVMRIRNTPSIIVEKSPSTAKRQNSIIKQQAKKHRHKHTDWLGRKRSALMVVASLIATVAFQAAISPPGGVWQNSELVDSNGNPVGNPHVVGKSVMAYNIPQAYGQFMIFDTIAFLASLSIILLLISGLPLKRRRWMWIQMVTMWIAITAQTVTYFLTLIHMSPKEVEGVLYHVTEISVLSWLSIMGIVFIGNVIRMTLWLLRRYGYIKEKETNPPPNDKEDDDDLWE